MLSKVKYAIQVKIAAADYISRGLPVALAEITIYVFDSEVAEIFKTLEQLEGSKVLLETSN